MEDKQSEIGLKLTNILAGLIQVIEAVAVITIIALSLNKGIDSLVSYANNVVFEYIAIVIKTVIIGGVIMGGFMAADLMKWIEYSSLLFMNKGNTKSAIIYFLFLILVGFGFYKAEKSASEKVGHGYFSVSEDKKAYTDDANYNLRLSGKEKIKADWIARKKELDSQKSKCATCGDIEAKYNSQIASWRTKRVVIDADRIYVQNNISAIASKRDGEKLAARQKHEAEIDKKYFDEEAIYNAAIKQADNTIRHIESTIDTGKVMNEAEIRQRKQDINFWASGFSLITLMAQIVLRIGRFHFLRENNRIDEVWDENNILLDIFQTLPYIGKYFEDTYWVEKASNFKKVKDANRVEYNRSRIWNTELSLKNKAKYWAYLQEKNLKDNFISRIKFAISGKNTMVDTDLLDSFSNAYHNGYSKKKQIAENEIENNQDFSEENSENIENNSINLEGQIDDFSNSIQNIIDTLMQLKSLYSETEFEDIQAVVNILENLKTI